MSEAIGGSRMRIGPGICGYLIMMGVLGIVVVSASALDQNISATDLTYITEQYPPSNFVEDGALRGISVDLLLKMSERMDGGLDRSCILVLPWDVGYQRALAEKNTVIFAAARLKEREANFKWVGPICPSQKVLFARKDRTLEIDGPEDLEGLRIGVIRNDSAVQMLLDMGIALDELVQEEDSAAIIQMLEIGTIDAWAYGNLAGPWLIKNSAADFSDFESIYVLGEVDLYYAFNTETPDSLVQKFQDALDDVKQELNEDGTNDYQKILYEYVPVGYREQSATKDQVMQLVNRTASDIEMDAKGTFAKITAAEHPYMDRDNPELYVFIYDTNVTIVADFNSKLVGKNVRGKSDVSGKMFRDEIVAGALEQGNGFVDYIYVNPVKSGLYYKTTYYKLTTGNDGKKYVVCCGMYKAET